MVARFDRWRHSCAITSSRFPAPADLEDRFVTDQPLEFIRLDGYPVRVTSLKRGSEPGNFQFVIVARGSRDPELLREILARPTVEIEIPGEVPCAVTVAGIDLRSSGEGAAMVTRFDIAFTPETGEVSLPSTLEDRMDALEREVAELRAIVDRLTTR